MACVLATHPHALHARHGAERPERPQRPHRPESLDAARAKERGSEVDEGNLQVSTEVSLG